MLLLGPAAGGLRRGLLGGPSLSLGTSLGVGLRLGRWVGRLTPLGVRPLGQHRLGAGSRDRQSARRLSRVPYLSGPDPLAGPGPGRGVHRVRIGLGLERRYLASRSVSQ